MIHPDFAIPIVEIYSDIGLYNLFFGGIRIVLLEL